MCERAKASMTDPAMVTLVTPRHLNCLMNNPVVFEESKA